MGITIWVPSADGSEIEPWLPARNGFPLFLVTLWCCQWWREPFRKVKTREWWLLLAVKDVYCITIAAFFILYQHEMHRDADLQTKTAMIILSGTKRPLIHTYLLQMIILWNRLKKPILTLGQVITSDKPRSHILGFDRILVRARKFFDWTS